MRNKMKKDELKTVVELKPPAPPCAADGGNNNLHVWKYDYDRQMNVCQYCGITNKHWGEDVYRIKPREWDR